MAVCIGRSEGTAQPVALERRGALRVAVWRQDGLAYVVIGEMPGELARDIAAGCARNCAPDARGRFQNASQA